MLKSLVNISVQVDNKHLNKHWKYFSNTSASIVIYSLNFEDLSLKIFKSWYVGEVCNCSHAKLRVKIPFNQKKLLLSLWDEKQRLIQPYQTLGEVLLIFCITSSMVKLLHSWARGFLLDSLYQIIGLFQGQENLSQWNCSQLEIWSLGRKVISVNSHTSMTETELEWETLGGLPIHHSRAGVKQALANLLDPLGPPVATSQDYWFSSDILHYWKWFVRYILFAQLKIFFCI